ncbi:MAG: acetylornithine carbamoyltransferase [Chitinophagaceae bacterium]
MKNFTSILDVDDIDALIKNALKFKADPFLKKSLGKEKTIGMLFLNPSLRTRISTQIAAKNLGMESIVFNVDKEGWALEFEDGVIMNGSTVEHIRDAAPVLGQYFDILCVRTFPALKDRDEDYAELVLNSFINFSGVPVVSLESATLHPLQSLADIVTIKELSKKFSKNRKPKIVLTWAHHIKPLPQCVPNSFTQWMNGWGEATFIITQPEGYQLSKEFTGDAIITYSQEEALKNADFVYVKNWSSYENYGEMPAVSGNWMLTNHKLAITSDAKVMHCLPVRRNVELADEILDGPHSLVTQQAGNRVWAAQAVLAEILKKL